MNWLHYLAEANIYLGVFYLCYCLLLTNETHYTLSRIYLLLACSLSFVLPVTQLGFLKPIVPAIQEQTPGFVNTVTTIHMAKPLPVSNEFTGQDAMLYVYFIGAAMAFGIFMLKLYKLVKLSRSKKSQKRNGYIVVQLNSENTAFSFFNYLFIGKDMVQSGTIIAHELVHIRQKHSIDIMLLELMKVISWFNPFVYLVQRSLKTIHEYIADERTAAHEQDALTYSSFLLNNAYGIQGSTIAHSFFNYNLLKKRIIMLNKNRSGKLARLKYLTVLPLCGGMLCASTLAFAKNYGWVDLTPKLSPAAKHLVKRLKIVDGAITAYSDNVGVKEKNGTTRKFTVNSISNADIAYLQRVHQLNVSIVEVDSATQKGNPAINFPAEQQNPNQHMPPPPPPPYDPAFAKLIEYVAKNTRYPAKAFEKKVDGYVLISLKLNAAHKITDMKVDKGIGAGCDEEAIRALKSYKSSISKPAGNYKLMVNFILIGKDGSAIHQNKQIDAGAENNYSFIGQIDVNGYLAPPPPPPAPPKFSKAAPGLPKVGVVRFPPPAPKATKYIPEPKIEVIHFAPPAGNYDTSASAKKAKAKRSAKIGRTLFPKPIVEFLPVKKSSKANDTEPKVGVIRSMPAA
ncbi:M56 family metallopeptidase [Mucilaginibacter sp.]|uniref:M56 family metallopeptidase n=1 Tax=Mucilaginibacter sp. TaxID=1882438 RepID=UPI0035BBD9C5